MLNKQYLKQKTVMISFVGCLILILGNFIPIVQISSDTIEYARTFNFIDYEGKYIVLVAVLAILLILLEEPKYAGVPLLVSSFVLVYLVTNKSELYDDCSFYESMFSWGPGLYFMILGNLAAYTAPVASFIQSKFTIKLKKEKLD